MIFRMKLLRKIEVLDAPIHVAVYGTRQLRHVSFSVAMIPLRIYIFFSICHVS